MLGHAEIKEALAVYDSLVREEQIELNAHLVGCSECAADLAAYRHMDRALRNMPDPRPSDRLLATVHEAAERERGHLQTTPASKPRPAPTPSALGPAPEPAAVVVAPEDGAGPPKWRRLLLPLALALLFVGSLWAGMRGEAGPSRNRIDVEQTVPVVTDTMENRALPVPPTEAPLTIDARGHVTITFACDEAVILSPEYRDLARSFESQNPDVTVKLIGWEQAVREWKDRAGTLAGGSEMDTMRAIAGGSDVFCAGSGAGLIQEGRVRNLAPLARADAGFAIDEFFPVVLQRVTDAGSLYLIPARFQPALIRYYPMAFEQAGLHLPKPGWSWDDFLVAASALTLRDGTNTRRWGFGEGDSNDLTLARFWSAVWSSQLNQSLVNGQLSSNPDVLDLFRWYNELYLRARAAPIPRGISNPSAGPLPSTLYEEQVRRGLFTMWTDKLSWTPPRGARAVPFPVSRAFDRTTPIGEVDGWAISSEAMHVDAAWRWVSFISQNLPADPEGLRVPARRSVPQMQAFWATVPPEDRDAYQYALEHLDNLPAFKEADGSYRLWMTLLAMIRGEIPLAALTEQKTSPRPVPFEPSQLITLTFAAPREQQADYEQAAAGFTEINPAIRIRIVPSEELLPTRSGTEILWNQMRVLAGRADAMLNAQVPALVRSGRAQGILYDVTELISQTLQRSDYYPNTLEGLQWRGRAFALPGRLGLQLIHYSQWMFIQMGIAFPQPGWTWSDFDRTVRAVALHDGSNSSWWGFKERSSSPLQLLTSRAGSLLDYSSQPATPLLDQPAAVEAITWYAGLLKDGLVAPAEQSADDAAMWLGLTDPSVLDALQSTGVGVAPFPVGPGSTATTPLELYDAFAISAGTRYPEETWKWLLYLQTHPLASEKRQIGAPARRDSGVAAEWPQDRQLREVIEYALEHTHRPAPLRAEEYLVTQQLASALNRIIDEGQAAPAAMKQAQATAEKDLGKK